MLWTLGGSLLHSGVVIKDKEYAYGGHDQPGVSGVYWTSPQSELPGATYRCKLVQGLSSHSDAEIQDTINELTSKPTPTWLNRAARIGLAFPCVVPKEWLSPPNYDTADGELIDEGEEDEHAAMLPSGREGRPIEITRDRWNVHEIGPTDSTGSISRWQAIPARDHTPPPRVVPIKDTSGRELPVSERAPMPKKL
ncbi:hypothetical protein LTR16_001119 [Cryomyces antarcticus]|uniref:PPPDE domain-containing protein n=1 Tax=Cryomyces antarcticus TaxID=329879 RepID=A0ABR0LZH7_9PEZI|nr:hypothetical protein LTR60_000748 [Cryomyces antarcticus]KAK5257273.1 hypothetical protein LTR16_001119 [Cryomyces antarcticus]